MATQFFYNTGTNTLGAGHSVGWTWWFGTAPTLLTLMPIAENANVPLVCSTPQVTRNDDGTVTYAFNVTNQGTQTATYHVTAGLIVR
jgi:hypothetical protein